MGGLQLNFGGIGVELRMKERRIEECIPRGEDSAYERVGMLAGSFELNS